MGLAVADQEPILVKIDASEQISPAASSAELAADALARASRKAAIRFEPPAGAETPAFPDVAQRLIDLELSGAAEELTWARYDG
jgi:hypothetical protein